MARVECSTHPTPPRLWVSVWCAGTSLLGASPVPIPHRATGTVGADPLLPSVGSVCPRAAAGSQLLTQRLQRRSLPSSPGHFPAAAGSGTGRSRCPAAPCAPSPRARGTALRQAGCPHPCCSPASCTGQPQAGRAELRAPEVTHGAWAGERAPTAPCLLLAPCPPALCPPAPSPCRSSGAAPHAGGAGSSCGLSATDGCSTW